MSSSSRSYVPRRRSAPTDNMLRGRVLNIVVLDIEIKTVLMKVRRRHISVYSGAVRDERDDAVIGGDSELEGDVSFN